MAWPDPNDHGLLRPEEAGLLIDQYELAMASSYLERGMRDRVVFELFVRRLPPHRDWLLVAGLGPALQLVQEMRFSAVELDYLDRIGLGAKLLDYLSSFRFKGDIDAMAEGTVAFAGEPLLRVTAERVEAQLLETLLLNQINFQTAIATKAARIVLAAGLGRPGRGPRIVDFSARRDHGVDAAMKAARSAFIGGATGTSNVAAAMRYGLTPIGTMAHSYVMSFEHEQEAFEAFMEDTPTNAVMLVDTYDTVAGVQNAIAASRATGADLRGVRLDSGDLAALSRIARRLLDEAEMPAAQIVASGELNERWIAELVRVGAPIDVFGVGTDLGTSRDSPAVSGIYKLVADHLEADGSWRPAVKRSPAKGTVPGPKQVFRRERDGRMAGDIVALAGERVNGQPLLVPVMRRGSPVLEEQLEAVRERAAAALERLPKRLRVPRDDEQSAYPVDYSPALKRLDPLSTGRSPSESRLVA